MLRVLRAPLLLACVPALLPSRTHCSTDTERIVAAVQRCVKSHSLEITPARTYSIQNFQDIKGLRHGTTVNVTQLVGAAMHDTVRTCARLVDAGMKPVAHVPARAFSTFSELDAFLKEVRATGCDEVLVLGGGGTVPVGPFSEAMQILSTGLLQKYGFKKVGVAGHPEGHPVVSEEVMTIALLNKVKWAQREGVDLYIETQFSFDAEPVIAWEKRIRRLLREHLGPEAKLPHVHLGVSGPAKISSLIRFAAFSGVGSSLQFIAKYKTNVLSLLTTAEPDKFIVGIAEHIESDPDTLIKALHFYPFGGFAKTAWYAYAVEQGQFDMQDDGCGFTTKTSP